MTTLHIADGASVDIDAIAAAGFEIVDGRADFSIASKIESGMARPKRTILMQPEPPVANCRISLHGKHAQFLAVFTFQPTLPNEYPITTTAAYPYRPGLKFLDAGDIPKRTGRGIYFAGRCRNSPDGAHCGGYRQYNLRESIARGLRERLGGTCLGQGWEKSTKKGWHENKRTEIAELCPDYVLALENCSMPNYVSEKLWDGMLSNRLTLYHGAPNVERLLPNAGYVNLRRWGAKTCPLDEVCEYLAAMTDEEYGDRVLLQRATVIDRAGAWAGQRAKNTQRIIEILTGARDNAE